MPVKPFYGYHPSAPLRLGRSFDPDRLDEPKGQCIDFSSEESDTGSSRTSVEAMVVQTEEQLMRVLGIDISLEASYAMAVSGKASYNYSQSTESKKRGLSLVLTARTDFGRAYMKSPKLTSEATELLSKKPEEFKQRYGTHYVLAEERGASLSVILALDEIDTATKTSIVGSLDASGGAGPLSASLKAKLSSELTEKFKKSMVTLSIFATGGEGFTPLGEIVQHGLEADSELKSLFESLKKALAAYSRASACPLGYFIGSLSHFGYKEGSSNPLTDELETKIFETTRVYRACKERRALTRRLLSDDDLRGWAFPKQFEKERLARKKELGEIEKGYLDLSKKAIKVYEDLLKGDLTAEPPPLDTIDKRFSGLLCPAITLRVDDVKTGARLNANESWQVIKSTTWDNVQSYMLVEGMGLRSIKILYKDLTRTEESGLEAYTKEIPSTGAILYTAYVTGNEFPVWNKAVAAMRKFPLGGGTRDRGTGEFRIVVEDLFGNVTETPIASVDWTHDTVKHVIFVKKTSLLTSTLSLVAQSTPQAVNAERTDTQ